MRASADRFRQARDRAETKIAELTEELQGREVTPLVLSWFELEPLQYRRRIAGEKPWNKILGELFEHMRLEDKRLNGFLVELQEAFKAATTHLEDVRALKPGELEWRAQAEREAKEAAKRAEILEAQRKAERDRYMSQQAEKFGLSYDPESGNTYATPVR